MARQQTLEFCCHPLAVPRITNDKQIIVNSIDTWVPKRKFVNVYPVRTKSTKYKSHTVIDVGFGFSTVLGATYFRSKRRFVCVKSPACSL
jgi:hypothetical protein